jgi:DNA-binding response OmpR family regulator
MKLLFLEDHLEAGAATQIILKREYAVDWAQTIEDAENFVEMNDYDLFVLDITVPDGNGIKFCKTIRAQGKTSAVLILTANDTDSDVVQALDAGADDYLTKPYSANVLLARLRALLRRPQNLIQGCVVLGEASIDLNQRTISKNNTTVHLRRKEYELLQYLLLNAGRVVSRQELFEHIWDTESNPLSNTVDVHIKMLREKLGHTDNKPVITTHAGVGYQIADTPTVANPTH